MPTDTPPARWFADTRIRILVAEESQSVVESEALQGNMPPLHVHHAEDEVFYVLDGRLSLLTPGGRVELARGEAAFAPRGIPHTYRVESDTARWLASTTTGGFAAFVAETSTPAEDAGYAPAERMPAPETLAAAAARREIELLGPPGATP
ncbi:MAG TPA: cupin domain-containing protein [Gaiellaceae bacterium]|nr:cupin domain-containing protein [Gaiellaceae bacterium]